MRRWYGDNTRGSGSGVEHRLAKARVASSNLVFRSIFFMFVERMWFSGKTSAFQADDTGSIPVIRSTFWAHSSAG